MRHTCFVGASLFLSSMSLPCLCVISMCIKVGLLHHADDVETLACLHVWLVAPAGVAATDLWAAAGAACSSMAWWLEQLHAASRTELGLSNKPLLGSCGDIFARLAAHALRAAHFEGHCVQQGALGLTAAGSSQAGGSGTVQSQLQPQEHEQPQEQPQDTAPSAAITCAVVSSLQALLDVMCRPSCEESGGHYVSMFATMFVCFCDLACRGSSH